MKCQVCGKKTAGFPDICPFCGAKMMALWNDWYRYPLYVGIGSVFIGVLILWLHNGAIDRDPVRLSIGILELVVGSYFVGLGALMRSRCLRTKELEAAGGRPQRE